MMARLYKHGALQTSTNRDFVVFQGRCVGGSSTINNGICLRVNEAGRTHPDAQDVLAKWARIGAPVDAGAFHASYDAVQRKLGIAPIEPRSGRHNGPNLRSEEHTSELQSLMRISYAVVFLKNITHKLT